MLEYLTAARLSWAVGIVILTLLVRFLQRLHFHRTLMKGLPGPPHNYITGSLVSMGKVIAKQPRRAAPQTFAIKIKEAYDLPDYFYFDSWPLGPPIMAILNTEMLNEIAVKTSLPKHPVIHDFMKNFGGPGNLVGSEGAEWKKWRAAFNPGFSANHLMSQVPVIIEQVEVFCNIMEQHAKKNELFRMESATTRLTVDIIGKIVLDLALNSQKGPNVLVEAFVSQTRWQSQGAQFQPSELIDIRRPFIQWYNNYQMDSYIHKALDARFASRESRGKSKHVVDLALEAYLKDVKGTTRDVSNLKGLDPEFKLVATSNLKTFIFAGHDTTSSTICYAYYYLSLNPSQLARIRAEHDAVFGPDPSTVASQLNRDPHLLNKLDYTLAVTREVLRVQPPASTIRQGQPGFFLRDPATGERLPTENFMLWPVNVGLHRSPKYWDRPDAFNPDRFLPGSEAGKNDREAWVPFSVGKRNCIGQELAIIETKIILSMTVRSWDFRAAYSELEKLKDDGSGYPSDASGVQEQFGDEAYQIQLGTAKPREGMPCRLTLRS